MTRRALLGLALAWVALAAVTMPAPAQDYPTRPIRVIATSSAGGTSDIFMRVLADELHKSREDRAVAEQIVKEAGLQPQ